MNMTAAVTATSGPGAHFAISSLRGGFASSSLSDQAAEPASRADAADGFGQDAHDAKEAAYPRFVSPVLEYNQNAERMVMLFRDPASGKTTDQIPSEAALKQYQEAARRTRSQRNSDILNGGETDTSKPGSGSSGSGLSLGSGGAGSGTGTDLKPGTAKVGDSFATADAAAAGGGASGGSDGAATPAPSPAGYRGTGAAVLSAGGSAGNGSAGVRFNFVV